MNSRTKRQGNAPFSGCAVLALAMGLATSSTTLGATATKAGTYRLGLSCGASVCDIGLSPLLKLRAPIGAIVNPRNRRHIELRGDVVLVTPAMELPMAEAELVISIDTTGKRPSELYGTARAPMDQLPLLSEAALDTVPSMAVGLVQPQTVTQLLGEEVPLNTGKARDGSLRASNQPYFLFHVDAGLSMSIDLGDDTKAGTSLGLEMPGSESATFILDTVDPYFYLAKGLSLELPERFEGGLYEQFTVVTYEKLDKEGNPKKTFYEHYDDQGRLVNKYTVNVSTGAMVENHYDANGQVTVTFFESNSQGDYRQEGSDGKNGRFIAKAEVTDGRRSKIKKRASDKDKDEAENDDFPIKAFGYSLHGWIEYQAKTVFEIPKDARRFAGQLYLQGTIPFGKFVSLEGDVVTFVGKDGFAQGGNGMLSLGLPGLPDFVEFSLELGNASAALVVSPQRQMTYVSGDLDPDTLFFDDILPIFPVAGARASGYIDNDLGDAHITIEGEMGLGADVLGNWIGLDLNSLQMTKANATIDTQGIVVSGMTSAQLHPSIKLSTAVHLSASVDWESPAEASLRMEGDMDVFGVGLEDVTVSLSKQGMFVNGAFVTPLSQIALAGEITKQGPALSGSASVMLGLGGITKEMRKAAVAIESAQSEVDRLKGQIERARATVQAERKRDAQRVQGAQNAVQAAQGTVDSLNSRINHEYSMISKRRSEIASWARWRSRAKWYQKAQRAARYAYEAGWRNADIGRRYGTIAAIKVTLVGANAALTAAHEALRLLRGAIATIPVDVDPRVAALIVANEAALLVLEAAKLPFENVPYIDGDFKGLIAAGLNHRGMHGTVSAKFEGYSLLKGEVLFASNPKACIDIPTFGSACTAI